MIEKVILDYLTATLTVPVYMERPEEDEGEFVVIEKTGSEKNNYISRATIAIQSFGNSLYRAAEINEAVKAAIDNLIALPEVSRSHLNSDYNFTDTTKKRYRYQAVYDITHY